MWEALSRNDEEEAKEDEEEEEEKEEEPGSLVAARRALLRALCTTELGGLAALGFLRTKPTRPRNSEGDPVCHTFRTALKSPERARLRTRRTRRGLSCSGTSRGPRVITENGGFIASPRESAKLTRPPLRYAPLTFFGRVLSQREILQTSFHERSGICLPFFTV